MEEVEITIAPLSGRQKLEMTSMIKQGDDGKLYLDKISQELFLIKHSIKSIKGLKDFDDGEYNLVLSDGEMTDECADELLGFLVNSYFTVANTQVMSGILGEVINPITGKSIRGISVERVSNNIDEEKKSL